MGQGDDRWDPGRSIGIEDAVRLFGSIDGREPLALGAGGFPLSGIGFSGGVFGDFG
jgi:hypothetical protein